MRRALLLRVAFGSMVAGLAIAASPATAFQREAIRAKPSEVPAGEAPGEVRRTIQPFGSWTVICDENIKRRRRVCNISQSFVDGEGASVFSWSLAATREGAPVLILRSASEGRSGRSVRLNLPGRSEPEDVLLGSCDARTCVGFLEVGPERQRRLRSGGTAQIELLHEGRFRTIDAPLGELGPALAALK